MKKIAPVQSRRNSRKRARKVAARHGRAGHWSAQPRPMMTSGKIGFEVGANIDATSFGGIGAVHRLAVKTGLPGAIDDQLELLKVHLPYHESDHVLNLAYNVLCGHTRLQDLERLRHDVAYMDALGAALIPDPTTAGDFCRRFTEDVRDPNVSTLSSDEDEVRWVDDGSGLGTRQQVAAQARRLTELAGTYRRLDTSGSESVPGAST